jgi:hypothetical protein
VRSRPATTSIMPSISQSYNQLSRARLFSSTCSASSPDPSRSSDAHSMPQLTHIDPVTGKPSMVDVSDKAITRRTATASGRIFLPPAAFELVSGAPVVAPVTDAPAIAALKEMSLRLRSWQGSWPRSGRRT